MKCILDFEPGDGTRYYCIWDRPSGFFGFGVGTRGPMQVNFIGRHLRNSYGFAQLLGIHDSPWTLAAAMRVYSYLAEEEIEGPLNRPTFADVLERWDAKGTWQQQLAVLKD